MVVQNVFITWLYWKLYYQLNQTLFLLYKQYIGKGNLFLFFFKYLVYISVASCTDVVISIILSRQFGSFHFQCF